MKIIILMLALIPATVWSAEMKYKVPFDVDLDKLQRNLKANGFKVGSGGHIGNEAFIMLDVKETKDPMPYVEALLSPQIKKMRDLIKKWQAGTITAGEKDQLLQMVVIKYLGL